MTPNDISTPKKAEDAPRHPLALLADWLEAERDEPADVYLLGRAETARLEDARAAVFNLDPAALRAQAEAEAGLREAARAIWDDAEQMPGQLRDRPDYVMHIRCDLICRLRDALAQAGGES